MLLSTCSHFLMAKYSYFYVITSVALANLTVNLTTKGSQTGDNASIQLIRTLLPIPPICHFPVDAIWKSPPTWRGSRAEILSLASDREEILPRWGYVRGRGGASSTAAVTAHEREKSGKTADVEPSGIKWLVLYRCCTHPSYLEARARGSMARKGKRLAKCCCFLKIR